VLQSLSMLSLYMICVQANDSNIATYITCLIDFSTPCSYHLLWEDHNVPFEEQNTPG